MDASASERDVTKPLREDIVELRMKSAPPSLTRELSNGGVVVRRQLSRVISNPFIINDGTEPKSRTARSHLKSFDGKGYVEPTKEGSKNGETKTEGTTKSKKKRKRKKKTKAAGTKCDDSRDEEMEEEHDSFSTDDDFFDDMEETAKLMEQRKETNHTVERGNGSTIQEIACDGAKDKDCSVTVGVEDQNGKSIKDSEDLILLSDYGENITSNVYVPSKVSKSGNVRSDGIQSTSMDSESLSKEDGGCLMKGETCALDMDNVKKSSIDQKGVCCETDDEEKSSVPDDGGSQRMLAFVGVGLITAAAILASYSYRRNIRRMVRRETCRKR